jgi:coronin-1B/1C/6
MSFLGADCKLIIWNVGTSEILSVIEHPDIVFSLCWNWDGSRVVTTCKDRKIRVYNPRTGEVECEGDGHEGAKPQKAIYLRDGLIFTTGFSKISERQYALRVESALGEPVISEDLDTNNGVMVPYYDPDVNLLFLCAKGTTVVISCAPLPERNCSKKQQKKERKQKKTVKQREKKIKMRQNNEK